MLEATGARLAMHQAARGVPTVTSLSAWPTVGEGEQRLQLGETQPVTGRRWWLVLPP